MAAENSIANGSAARKTYIRRQDPRRKPVRQGFADATRNHPDRNDLVSEIEARIEVELAAQPQASIGKIFFAVAEEFEPHLDINFNRLSDELLGYGENWDEPNQTAPPNP